MRRRASPPESATSEIHCQRIAPIAPQTHLDFAKVGVFALHWVSCRGTGAMSKASEYRLVALDCLSRAKAAPDERDRPHWLMLAQSWFRLADRTLPAGSGPGQARPAVVACRSRSGLRIRP